MFKMTVDEKLSFILGALCVIAFTLGFMVGNQLFGPMLFN